MSNIDTFLKSCTILDTETTNLYPDKAEIVEIAAANWTGVVWDVRGKLLNARNGIPPEASAKNNIGPRLIKNEPYFDQVISDIKNLLRWDAAKYFVAHNCSYDQSVLSAAWDRCGSIADAKSARNQADWICTWRLSRQILGHQFGDIEYGLNYLRYLLDLDLPDDHSVHRAADDTLTCAMLLQALIDFAIEQGQVDGGADLGQQLHALCWDTIKIAVWPFGKYRGTLLDEIPMDYWSWALKNLPALQESDANYDRDLAENVRLVLEKKLADA